MSPSPLPQLVKTQDEATYRCTKKGIALRAPVNLSQKARYFLCKPSSLWHIPGLADCFLLRDPNTPDEWANKISSYPPDRGRVWLGI